MHAALNIVSTLIIFFAPGVFIVAFLGGGKKSIGLTLGEQMFLCLSGSLLASGWVGLFLAELGVFSVARVAGVVGALVALGTIAAWKRLTFRSGAITWDEVTVLICLIGFAAIIYFPPFEYILGGRDPGVYVNTGFHLAQDGNLTWIDPLVTSIPEEERALFFKIDRDLPAWSQPRFLGFHMESPETGRVVPQGLHLYPTMMAIASGLFQMKSGLYATPLFALLGVAGFFLALRRLFGVETALWASGLMTVFQIQIWFARFPNAEILVQFLYVTALLAFALMEKYRSGFAGALAGAAFGATLLVRVENILFFVPLGLFLGWKRLRRETGRPELAFLSTLVALTIHAALHARFISWPYVSEVFGRHYWRWVSDHLAFLIFLGLAAFLLVDRLAAKWIAGALSAALGDKPRAAFAGVLFLLANYAYFIRPIWHGARTAPHDAEAFLRMGWYLHPLGLALVIGGAMFLAARSRREQAFFFLVSLTFSVFFFYKVRVWHDHYFAMRRFIPVILPGFFAAIAIFLVELRTARGWIGKWAPNVIGAALLLVYFVGGKPLWSHEEFPQSLDFVEDLARHIGERDVVIFPRREGLHLLEPPLAELEGKNVLEFYSLNPDRRLLESLIAKWKDQYDDIYFVTNYKTSLSGLFTQNVKEFWLATKRYEFSYDGPPSKVEPFHLRFSLSKAVDLNDLAARIPKLRRVDVGASDDMQLAWFHEKELDEDGTSYRWTQGISTVFLPALDSQSTEIVLRMAGPKQGEGPIRDVRVSVNERTLATISVGPSFETYRIALPSPTAAVLGDSFHLVMLSTQTWRPSNWRPGATDVRDLGVRVNWIEVQ